ncbi:Putative odorant receptor 22c [Cyphomyrmex costatus]|uniref:Putative odorant receptor 22c n=1 Tax=Cyphomyrmex costatus TaxID=456900 RepID=A0A195D1V2_9HYME|nr:Putative odorant receptor 22c [Cyphomyrmex costatus]
MSSYFTALMSMLINMFMFCYTGEQLTVQAEKVARTSCMLEWYRLPNKDARGIVLVIIMSNLPTKITAGNIMDLSLKTYGDEIGYCSRASNQNKKGEKVSLTLRTLEWYRLQDTTARALILLITVSENPLKLKAGNFIDISLRTFGNGEKVSLTTRTLEWYRLQDATARALILLISISENPLKLKAGNFIDISLKRFGSEWEDRNVFRLGLYFIGLIMFSFNIFIYCYIGEQIIEQEEKIALTACTLEWHRLPDVKARALILLISISENPLRLKAGNFIDLTLRTFGNDWQNRNIATLFTYWICIVNVTTHMFLFCYTGEQLTGQAEKVAIASCGLEWYRLPDKKARSVVLLIIMSNAPTKISGKFINLSLKTFGDRFRIKCMLRTDKVRKYQRIFVKVHKEMSQNKHYQNDIVYVTQPTRNILLALGAWPSINKGGFVHSKVHNLLLICMSYTLLFCDLIPGILYWLMKATTHVRLQMIPLLLYDFMSASQYSIFISRYNQLRQCLKHVEEDWENVLSMDARNIMLKSARTGKRLVTICALFMYSGVITFRAILPLFQGKIVIDQNITIRRFASPGYYFSLDVQDWQTRNIGTLCSYLISIINVIIHMFLFCYTGEQLTGQAEKVAITSCVLEWYRLPDKKARSVVLLILMSNMPTKISAGQFVDLSLKTFGNDWESKNIATVCTYGINIINVTIHTFLFCYTGEQLTSQAEKVAIASCELEWFRLPDKNTRSVVLLVLMSNMPTKLYAGQFADLSLKTFGNIMKTAGTYFNMIRSVID